MSENQNTAEDNTGITVTCQRVRWSLTELQYKKEQSFRKDDENLRTDQKAPHQPDQVLFRQKTIATL